MRSFTLFAFITLALVAQTFAAPTCGCDDVEKVKSFDASNNNKQSNYNSAGKSEDKVDVKSVNGGVATSYGSSDKEANYKNGENKEDNSCVSIKGDQGSTYDAKASHKKSSASSGSAKEQNSYYSSKPDDSC